MGTLNGGAPVILQLRGAGYDTGPHNVNGDPLAEQGGVAASRFDSRKMDALLMIVVFSQDIVLRTGSCEVRS